MSPTPPSTTPSSGSHSPEQFRVVRKRNRVPLSCYPCRTRKKCNRANPCSNCTKRDGQVATSCSYATPVTRKKNATQSPTTPDDMQNRIDRLEGLVLSLMRGGANIDPASAATAGRVRGAPAVSIADSSSDPKADRADEGTMRDDSDDSDTDDGLAGSLGMLKVDADRGKSMYLGQESWHTLLADIAEVKQFYTAHKLELEKSYERVMLSKPQTALYGPTFLMSTPPATETELRAELPPKSTVLILCGRYFNSMDNAVNVVHAPTFHEQLRAHWEDPSKCSIMWLGLLYSILCLAMLSYHRVGDEPPEWKGRTLELAALYRMRTSQCLHTGDWTRPAEYTVETMLLYLFGEHTSRWDADLALWLLVSLITRIAFRMGYHRDAKWFSNITPFQAEMRRRTWALVRMSDVVFSQTVSLPSMIQEDSVDTELPHNLFDEEFGPGTKVLPPSRPNVEPTPISYMIAKVKLTTELGNILQTVTRVKDQVHYDEILRLDARLKAVKDELPPHLRMQPLEECHQINLIIAKFNLDILHLKIVAILHRKYINRTKQHPRYAYSRRSAIEAALGTLRHLATLHRESQPNGRLRSIHWFVASIATKDFLLPAILLVLDLHYDSPAERSGQPDDATPPPFWMPEQRAEMIRSLEVTVDIWRDLADGATSMESVKASQVLSLMLAKIKEPASQDASANPDLPGVVKNMATARPDGSKDMSPDQSAALALGMLSGAPTPNTAAALSMMQASGGPSVISPSLGIASLGSNIMGPSPSDMSIDMLGLNPSSAPSLFSNMMDSNINFAPESGDLDWNLFENYAQTTNWGTDQSFNLFPAANPDGSGA